MPRHYNYTITFELIYCLQVSHFIFHFPLRKQYSDTFFYFSSLAEPTLRYIPTLRYMLQSVFPLLIPYLFEEEKVPVFLSSSTFLAEYAAELQSIRADFHTLQDYLDSLRESEDLIHILDNWDQDSNSS